MTDWTDAELRSAVAAYKEMMELDRRGAKFVKKAYFRDLVNRHGRTTGAFDYRMQNISAVLHALGREWLPGAAPAKNVGAGVAKRIEQMLAEAEGTTPTNVAAERVEVASQRERMRKKREKGKQPRKPAGSRQPATQASTVTTYIRDPKVRAWVLDQAEGKCEACGEPAPFTGADGFPYLEVHHVRTLADGGPDTPENAIAACPNCHRRLHFGGDAHAFRRELYSKVGRLIQE